MLYKSENVTVRGNTAWATIATTTPTARGAASFRTRRRTTTLDRQCRRCRSQGQQAQHGNRQLLLQGRQQLRPRLARQHHVQRQERRQFGQHELRQLRSERSNNDLGRNPDLTLSDVRSMAARLGGNSSSTGDGRGRHPTSDTVTSGKAAGGIVLNGKAGADGSTAEPATTSCMATEATTSSTAMPATTSSTATPATTSSTAAPATIT